MSKERNEVWFRYDLLEKRKKENKKSFREGVLYGVFTFSLWFLIYLFFIEVL